MPQPRVLRNDARILDAGLEAAAAAGWSALTPTAIARRSGMSQRAVQARYRQRPDLGAAVWRERAGATLRSALEAAVEAAEATDEAGFALAMDQLARPNTGLLAAAELLVISMFEPAVRDAIETTVTHEVQRWCTPNESVGAAKAAGRAYVLMLGLGLIAAARRPGIERLDFHEDFDRIHSALRSPVEPMSLPPQRPVHVTGTTPFDTGDPIHDALLVSVLEQVGQLGFEGATTMSIAGAAGVSETTIFVRYPTKLALFVDAATRQQAIAFRTNEQFTRSISDQHGRGVAAAVELREFLHPDVSAQRAIYAEEIRVSWHDDDLRQRLEAEVQTFVDGIDPSTRPNAARLHVQYATGLGFALLPLLLRDAWTLPFDVVTRPLESEHSSR